MRTFPSGAVAASVLAAVVSAQGRDAPPPPLVPGAGATSMCANDRFVYVLRGDVLWQLDANTLAVVRSVPFPAGGGPPAPPDPVAARDAPAPPVAAALPPPRPAKERAAAVAAALKWLAAHQDKDGRWDCDQFTKHDDAANADCGGPGNAVHDVGATGLAVLALLGDGSTPERGQWQGALQRAAKWLVEQQQDNGLFGVAASHDFVYDHAIAAYAVCEMHGTGVEWLKRAAQRGIDYLEAHRNPYSVWRYQPRDNDNDTSVTTWAVLALTSADRNRLTVNREALKLAGVWYDQVSDHSGHHGYSKQGQPSSRKPGDHALRFPPEHGEAMTAAATVARFAIGQTPRSHPVIAASADLVVAKPPRWEPGHADPIYWFFGARAMLHVGGPHHDAWQRALDALLPAQRRDGGCTGSWDPIGVWDEDGGRVVTTALCALALQAGLPAKIPPK